YDEAPEGEGEIATTRDRRATKPAKAGDMAWEGGVYATGGGIGSFLGDEALGIDDEVLDELLEIFGTGHEYDFAMEEPSVLEQQEHGVREKRLEEVFEPGELAAQMMTEEDEVIRLADIPERMMLRSTKLDLTRKLLEDEITDEVTWAAKHIRSRQAWGVRVGPPPEYLLETHCLAGMLAVFKLISTDFCEVPYIATHRRDMFVTPLEGVEEQEDRVKEWLSLDDLWLLYDLDVQFRSFLHRRETVSQTLRKLKGEVRRKVQRALDAHEFNEGGFEDDVGDNDNDNDDNDDGSGARYEFVQMYPSLLRVGDEDFVRKLMDSAERIEEVNDIMDWLQAEYFAELQKANMRQEGGNGEEGEEAARRGLNKRPTTSSILETARRNELDKFISNNMGITARQFGEVLSNTEQHYIDDHNRLDKPEKAAELYLTREFLSPGMLVRAATAYFAYMIATDPSVRRYVRRQFEERAHVWVWATKRGCVEISYNDHPYFEFKYLRPKPVASFAGLAQILSILKAEAEGLVKIGVTLSEVEKAPRFGQGENQIEESEQAALVSELASEMDRMIRSDAVHESAEAWNEVRSQAVREALSEHLVPMMSRWVLGRLRGEAEQYVGLECQRSLEGRINVRPALNSRMQETDTPRVVAVVGGGFAPSSRGALRIVYVDDQGRYIEHFTADTLRNRSQEPNAAYGQLPLGLQFDDGHAPSRGDGVQEMLQMLNKYQPDVVAVSGMASQTMRLLEDVRAVVDQFCERTSDDILVTMVDDEAARIYWTSERAKQEFPNLRDEERYAVSVARTVQCPLTEYSGLGDGLLGLPLHPAQKQIPTEVLKGYLERALVNVVNQVGVDINAAARFPYRQHILQYVCGLGPRKAKILINRVNHLPNHMLDSRSDLIREGIMTRTIFINSASFLKILPQGLDILDTTRVHPEDYELARKMAADALDIEEDDEDDDLGYSDGPSRHVATLMRGDTYRIDDLILTEYSRELERMLDVPKLESLKLIKRELKAPYGDMRRPFQPPSPERVFNMLTGEKIGESLTDDGTSLVAINIARVMPRFAIGLLDSGIEVFINIANASDSRIDTMADVLAVGQSVPGVVKMINLDKLSVDVSICDSDVERVRAERSNQLKAIPMDVVDKYFDVDAERRQRESHQVTTSKSQTLMRQIQHPWFRAINGIAAEKYLASRPIGSCVIRPSSRGFDHIAVTWKVAEDIYQHIDVEELNKPSRMGVGRTLKVGKYTYSDLDELITFHIEPISSKFDEARRHAKFYDPGTDLHIEVRPDSRQLETAEARERRAQCMQDQIASHLDALANSAGRGVYCLCYSYSYPGSLQIVFKATPRSRSISHRTVRVMPDAYVLVEGGSYPTITALINGFKTIQMNAVSSRPSHARQYQHPPSAATTIASSSSSQYSSRGGGSGEYRSSYSSSMNDRGDRVRHGGRYSSMLSREYYGSSV
ncbi:Transcription elongation factor spt6, partial [Spiromyces aspiralis]